MVKIDVKAGWFVDRIDSITCWWDGPGRAPNNRYIYSQPVGIGGNGGTYATSSCQQANSGGPFAKGIDFHSGYWLDGFALDCGS